MSKNCVFNGMLWFLFFIFWVIYYNLNLKYDKKCMLCSVLSDIICWLFFLLKIVFMNIFFIGVVVLEVVMMLFGKFVNKVLFFIISFWFVIFMVGLIVMVFLILLDCILLIWNFFY